MKKLFFILLILICGCTTGEVIREEFEGPYNVTKVVDD